MEHLLRVQSMSLYCVILFLPEARDGFSGRAIEFFARDDPVTDEVIDVHALYAGGEVLLEARRGMSRRCRKERIDAVFRIPTDPFVTDRLLHDGAPECRYTDHGVVGCRGIAEEDHHGAPRDTPVRGRPRVTEVPPDVREEEAGVLATDAGFDELEVRGDDGRERGESFVVAGNRGGMRKLRGQCSSVTHERVDRVPTVIGEAPLLHAPNKRRDAGLAQLRISLDEMTPSHRGLHVVACCKRGVLQELYRRAIDAERPSLVNKVHDDIHGEQHLERLGGWAIVEWLKM
jgi:hypothetical protein